MLKVEADNVTCIKNIYAGSFNSDNFYRQSGNSSDIVQMGIDYRKRFFDFTYANDFDALTSQQQLADMTDYEKYRSVYEKYRHCYGTDFLKAEAIDYPVSSYSENDPYIAVLYRFRKEIYEVCGSENAVKEARRDACYGGLTDDQVRAAIIDSYDLSHGITFEMLYDIAYDIWSVGLDGGLHFRLDDLFNDGHASREEMLDKKVTPLYFEKLQQMYDNGITDGIMISPDFQKTLTAIKNCI